MKSKISLLVLSLFLLSAFLYADCGKSAGCGNKNQECSEDMMQKHLDKLSLDLSLTAEQKSKISDIFKAGFQEMKAKKDAFKEEMNAKKESFKNEMKAWKEQKDSLVKEILNEEQKVKFTDICKKMEENINCQDSKGKECKKANKKCDECKKMNHTKGACVNCKTYNKDCNECQKVNVAKEVKK